MKHINGPHWLSIAAVTLLSCAFTALAATEAAGTRQIIQNSKVEIDESILYLIRAWAKLPDEMKTPEERSRLIASVVAQGYDAVPCVIGFMNNGVPESGLNKGFFATVLGEMKDFRATQALFHAFVESKEIDETVEILAALEKLNDPAAIPLLLPQLDSPIDGEDLFMSQKRATAIVETLQGLSGQGMGTDVVVNECARLMSTASDVLKIRMSQVLQAASSRGAEELLIACLSDSSSIVRGAGLVALSQTRSQVRAPGIIIALLENGDHNDRKEACLALGRLKYLPSIPVLISFLNDPDNGVKSNALWALQHISSRNYDADLKIWKDWWEKEKLESATRFKSIVARMTASTADELPVLVEELGELTLMRREVIEAVTPQLRHRDFRVRAAACSVLGRMVDLKSVPALNEQLRDANREVSHTAWRSLKELTGKKFPLKYETWSNWYDSTH